MICIENFFNDPYKIIKIGNSFKYSSQGAIRGIRSEPLHTLDQDLFETINLKIINNFYPNINLDKTTYKAITYFQKNEYDINDGWIHNDPGLITAIIYLTPEETSGTSIYKIKNKDINLPTQYKKQDYFTNFNKYSIKQKADIQKLKLENNSYFEKTASFNGEFNRMIAFKSNEWHAAELQKENKDRVLIITFIEEINQH